MPRNKSENSEVENRKFLNIESETFLIQIYTTHHKAKGPLCKNKNKKKKNKKNRKIKKNIKNTYRK